MLKESKQLKFYFLLLTLLLFIWQFYSLLFKLPFDLTSSGKKIGFFNLYLYHLTRSFDIWRPLIAFVFIQLVLQLSVTLLAFLSFKNCCQFFKLKKNILLAGIIYWVILETCIYLWNWFLYPYSLFSQTLQLNFSSPVGHFVLISLLISTTAIISLVFFFALTYRISKNSKASLATFIFLSPIVIIGIMITPRSVPKQIQNSQPNIIIVITDSLKPDLITKSHNKLQSQRIKEIFNNTISFENAFTPFGRSTPALMSVLTSQYPKKNGARFNLIDNNELKFSNLLTTTLKSQDYETIYASDSLQFINPDPRFGFDHLIAPSYGIYDFIFSFANDFPLSNLLMNTDLAKILFPYNYANRMTYQTYLPKTFNKMLSQGLTHVNFKKPLFLMIDLSLAHHPYVWAKQPRQHSLYDQYVESFETMTSQYLDILETLKKFGLLQKAILITISDHGDSLGLPGDRIITEQNYLGPSERIKCISRYPYSIRTPNSNQLIGIDTSSGHGTDLLSLSQLKVPMIFKFFNYGSYQPQIISSRVSLVDITSTLLELLNLPAWKEIDGISLVDLMSGKPRKEERTLFFESGIDVPAIDLNKISETEPAIKHLIDQYSSLYTINSRDLTLVLSPNAVKKQLQKKQRGVMEGEWLLVHFPGKSSSQSYIITNPKDLKKCYYSFPVDKENSLGRQYICFSASDIKSYYVLVNLTNKKWQILYEDEAHQHALFKRLLGKLTHFFSDEI